MNDIALNWQDLLSAVVVSMMLLFSALRWPASGEIKHVTQRPVGASDSLGFAKSMWATYQDASTIPW
jgi:hypothetical protein